MIFLTSSQISLLKFQGHMLELMWISVSCVADVGNTVRQVQLEYPLIEMKEFVVNVGFVLMYVQTDQ